MLESVISLSEEENLNNNASYSQDMTLDAKEDNNKQEETFSSSSTSCTTQHYTKNPSRTSRDTDHIKARNTVTFEDKEDSNDSEKENHHESVSQNSDISRTYENFTLGSCFKNLCPYFPIVGMLD